MPSAVNDNFLGMKNSIIFISALSLVAVVLASCKSIPRIHLTLLHPRRQQHRLRAHPKRVRLTVQHTRCPLGEAPRILSPLITDRWGGLRPMGSDMLELGRSDQHRFKAVRNLETRRSGIQHCEDHLRPKPSWSNSPIAEQVRSVCHDTLP